MFGGGFLLREASAEEVVMNHEDDLAAYMADAYDYEFGADTDAEPPRIESHADADRLLFLIRRADAQMAEIEQTAAEQIKLVNAWKEDRLAGHQRTIAWAQRSLEGWARGLLARGGGPTWTLPHGIVKLLKPRARLVVENEAALLGWLDKLGGGEQFVKVERSPKLQDLKKLVQGLPDGRVKVKGDGEIVPGVAWVQPGERNFSQVPGPTPEIESPMENEAEEASDD